MSTDIIDLLGLDSGPVMNDCDCHAHNERL